LFSHARSRLRRCLPRLYCGSALPLDRTPHCRIAPFGFHARCLTHVYTFGFYILDLVHLRLRSYRLRFTFLAPHFPPRVLRFIRSLRFVTTFSVCTFLHGCLSAGLRSRTATRSRLRFACLHALRVVPVTHAHSLLDSYAFSPRLRFRFVVRHARTKPLAARLCTRTDRICVCSGLLVSLPLPLTAVPLVRFSVCGLHSPFLRRLDPYARLHTPLLTRSRGYNTVHVLRDHLFYFWDHTYTTWFHGLDTFTRLRAHCRLPVWFRA